MENVNTRILSASKNNRRRMLFSIVCSIVIHAGAFIAIQYGVKVKPPIPEYTKPLFVILQSPPEMEMKAELSVAQEIPAEEGVSGVTAAQDVVKTPSGMETYVEQREANTGITGQRPEEKLLEEIKEPEVVQGVVEQKPQQESRVLTETVPPVQEKITKGKPETLVTKSTGPEKVVEKKVEKVTRAADKPVKKVEEKVTSAPVTSVPKTSEKPMVEMVEKKDTVEILRSKEISRPQEEVKIVKPSTERWRDFVPEQQKPGEQVLTSKPEVEGTPIIDVSRLDKAVSGEAKVELQKTGRLEDSGARAGAYSGSPQDKVAGDIEEEVKAGGLPYIEWEEGSGKRRLLSPAEKPEVPEWVQKEGRDLKVVISFLVTPDGNTISHRVLASSGYTEVDTKAVESAKRLKFVPIKENREDRGKITYIISIKTR